MEWIYWLFLVFALIYEPIFGYRDYQKFKRKVKTDGLARIGYYKSTMAGLWIPAGLILVLAASTELTLGQIGLSFVTLKTEIFGSFLTYLALTGMIVYALVIVGILIGSKFSFKLRNSMEKAKKQELHKSSFGDILPTNRQEKKMWTYVSITAGITEEILYRGFLIFALGSLFPGASIWFSILTASLLFGLAHTYQGFIGVMRTTLIGIWFTVVYLAAGSILPLIAFHALVDYFGKINEE